MPSPFFSPFIPSELSTSRPNYVPPTKPYELSVLAYDLVLYARYLLKPGGLLVFFLPTVNEEYAEVDIPVVEGMKVTSNSLQDFGNWGRRVSVLASNLLGVDVELVGCS